MVIKKDPRAILDMLSKPVECDEDEFLDKLDKDKSFSLMPNKPAQDLNVNPLMNDRQAAMLNSIADEQVDEEDFSHAAVPGAAALPVEMSKKERRFFSLFQSANGNASDQTSVPEGMNLNLIHAQQAGGSLPRVSMSAAEVEAKEEDMARREAYIAEYAKQQLKDGKVHDKFVNIFDSAKEQR